MPNPNNWDTILGNLKVDRSKGVAPHKPLLLLVLLDELEKGVLGQCVELTPSLAHKFNTLWSVVAHRRSQAPSVRLPFHHLSGDGLLKPFDENGTPSKHRSLTQSIKLDSNFFDFIRDKKARRRAQDILISKYFEPKEQISLCAIFGRRPLTDCDRSELERSVVAESKTAGREVKFRLDIVAAYGFRCALTGYRVTTVEGAMIVDAAHIHKFSASRNNNVRNGIALSKNAHWMFDNGLWSIGDDHRVLVASSVYDESSPHQEPLSFFNGRKLYMPTDDELSPDPKHLAWHRKKHGLAGWK